MGLLPVLVATMLLLYKAISASAVQTRPCVCACMEWLYGRRPGTCHGGALSGRSATACACCRTSSCTTAASARAHGTSATGPLPAPGASPPPSAALQVLKLELGLEDGEAREADLQAAVSKLQVGQAGRQARTHAGPPGVGAERGGGEGWQSKGGTMMPWRDRGRLRMQAVWRLGGGEGHNGGCRMCWPRVP